MPTEDSYNAANVVILNTHRTPIQKQPEALLCLVGLSQRYFLGDDVYPTFIYDDDREMDLFNLISAPNPTKVKSGTHPRAAHELPLLTVTASRVIDIEEAAMVSESPGTPSTIKKSPLDFSNKDPPPTITERRGTEDRVREEVAGEIPLAGNVATREATAEIGLEAEVAAMGPPINKRHRKRVITKAEANVPPKVLRRDHDTFRPTQSAHGGKSLASTRLDAGPLLPTPTTQDPSTTTKSVSDPEPMSYAEPQSLPKQDIAQGRLPRFPSKVLLPQRLTSSSLWGVPSQEGRTLPLP
ncbi:hypothetical protein Tco_0127931 [Tanacetum coccineum]